MHFFLNSNNHESFILASLIDGTKNTITFTDSVQMYNLPPVKGDMVLFGFGVNAKSGEPQKPEATDRVFMTSTWGDKPNTFLTYSNDEMELSNMAQLYRMLEQENLIEEAIKHGFEHEFYNFTQLMQRYHIYELGKYEYYILSWVDIAKFMRELLVEKDITTGDIRDEYRELAEALAKKREFTIQKAVETCYSLTINEGVTAVKLFFLYEQENVNEVAKALQSSTTLPSIVLLARPTRGGSDFVSIRTNKVDASLVAGLLDKKQGKERVANAFIQSAMRDMGSNIGKYLEESIRNGAKIVEQ